MKLPATVRHGTSAAYNKYKCRCPTCRAHMAVYMRQRRASFRARGLCTECGDPVAPGRVKCQPHLEESRRHATSDV